MGAIPMEIVVSCAIWSFCMETFPYLKGNISIDRRDFFVLPTSLDGKIRVRYEKHSMEGCCVEVLPSIYGDIPVGTWEKNTEKNTG